MKKVNDIPKPTNAADPLAPDSDLPPDADIEERFNDFWKRNGTFIFGVFGLVTVVVVGIQLAEYLKEKSTQTTITEYGTLETIEAKLEFAGNHDDSKIGGMAYLEVANSEFADANFQSAAEHYALAATALEETPLVGPARLGEAVSKLRQDAPDALSLLDQVARDPSIVEPVRGEAAYLLAFAYFDRGDHTQATRALDLLDSLDKAQQWQGRGQALRDRLPVVETETSVPEVIAG